MHHAILEPTTTAYDIAVLIKVNDFLILKQSCMFIFVG